MSVLRVRLTRGQVLRGLVFREFVDLMREAVERAGLPVVRNRRGAPRLETGPHLAPAHTSRCEYMDFELTDPITGREFLQRLLKELPAGVEAVSARRLPPGSKSLKAAVRVLRYRVSGDFAPEQAERFRQAGSWPLVRIRKGRERCLDLRRSVARLDVGPGEVTMDIEVRADGTPRPEEVVASVFGIPLEAALLLKTERSGVLLSDRAPARS